MQTFTAHYNSIALESISSLVVCNIYPTFESAWLIFLSSCERKHLPVNISPYEIPPFHWLLFLQRKVDAFLASYTTLRSILSVKDAESDILQMLRRFDPPSLSHLMSELQSDPNEIDVSVESVADTIESFEQYGVGNLVNHPILRRYFTAPLQSTLFATTDILRCLDMYLSRCKPSMEFDTRDFASFVCTEYNLQTLEQGGVCLIGDLKLELAMLHEVRAARTELLVAMKKAMLEDNYFDLHTERYHHSSCSGVERNDVAGENVDTDPAATALSPVSAVTNAGSGDVPPQSSESDVTNESLSSSDTPNVQDQAVINKRPEKKRRRRGGGARCDALSIVTETGDNNKPCYDPSEQTIFPPSVPSVEGMCSACTCCTAEVCECGRHFLSVASGRVLCLLQQPRLSGTDPPPVHTTMVSVRHVLRLEEQRLAYKGDNDTLLPVFMSGGQLGSARVVASHELVTIIPWREVVGSRSPKGTGRWGEALVYHYLRATLPSTCSVSWVNQDQESNAAYDLIIFDGAIGGLHGTVYADVKSTWTDDRNVFPISLDEWKFITGLPKVQYDIYRVYNAGDPNRVRIVVYHDVERLVRERSVSLCLAV